LVFRNLYPEAGLRILLRAGKDGIGLPLAGPALPGGDFLKNFV
jgi:hypothetical protein